MFDIGIISASIRTSRNSHRVSLYLERFITENQVGRVDMIDLKELNFPLFEERLHYMKDPPSHLVQFSERIKKLNGVLIVTPEYNGGYPGSLKNVIDLLLPEWKRKPIGIATVSSGGFGGSQVVPPLAFTFLKMGALVTPAVFRVSKVTEFYTEDGTPADKAVTDKRAKAFIDEFAWVMEARRKMESA